MLDKTKKKWNSAYSQSLGFTVLAIIALFKNDMVEISLLLFGVSMVLIELGFIQNQNKEIISFDRKIFNIAINSLFKGREDIIKQRMEEYKNGTAKIMTQEDFDNLLKEAEAKDGKYND